MLFVRLIIGNQISDIHASFNKSVIFQRYENMSLGNKCAEVISINPEKVKI